MFLSSRCSLIRPQIVFSPHIENPAYKNMSMQYTAFSEDAKTEKNSAEKKNDFIDIAKNISCTR